VPCPRISFDEASTARLQIIAVRPCETVELTSAAELEVEADVALAALGTSQLNASRSADKEEPSPHQPRARAVCSTGYASGCNTRYDVAISLALYGHPEFGHSYMFAANPSSI
jgi:hypothetical protein